MVASECHYSANTLLARSLAHALPCRISTVEVMASYTLWFSHVSQCVSLVLVHFTEFALSNLGQVLSYLLLRVLGAVVS